MADLDAWRKERHLEHWDGVVEPLPEVRGLWDAFWDLCDDRPMVVAAGMGGGAVIHRRIPYVSRAKWLDDHGYFGARREWAEEAIRAMDGLYVAHSNRSKDEDGNGDGDDPLAEYLDHGSRDADDDEGISNPVN